MDSFFMVLKKKNNQLTSLHVIHHAIMPMVSWIFLKYVGGGHSTFFMFLNMGVHVVMYFYYLMSGIKHKNIFLFYKSWIIFSRNGTRSSEISLVEALHHRDAVAPVRLLLHPRLHSSVHILQLSIPGISLHPFPRSSLLLTLHQLLHSVLHQEGSNEESSMKIFPSYHGWVSN